MNYDVVTVEDKLRARSTMVFTNDMGRWMMIVLEHFHSSSENA